MIVHSALYYRETLFHFATSYLVYSSFADVMMEKNRQMYPEATSGLTVSLHSMMVFQVTGDFFA